MTSRGSSEQFMNPFNSKKINTQKVEKRVIKPEEFGMLSDIVLFTPFPMLFEPPKDDKNDVMADLDSLISGTSDLIKAFFGKYEEAKIFVPFAQVKKSPYYLENMTVN